jgi:hypothetical protein
MTAENVEKIGAVVDPTAMVQTIAVGAANAGFTMANIADGGYGT